MGHARKHLFRLPAAELALRGIVVLVALTLGAATSTALNAAQAEWIGAHGAISAAQTLSSAAIEQLGEPGSSVFVSTAPCPDTCVLRCKQTVCASGGSAVVDSVQELAFGTPTVSAGPHGVVPTAVFFGKILRPPRGRDGSFQTMAGFDRS